MKKIAMIVVLLAVACLPAAKDGNPGMGGSDSAMGDAAVTDLGSSARDVVSPWDQQGVTPLDCPIAEGFGAEWVYPSGRRGSVCAPVSGNVYVESSNCISRYTGASTSFPGPGYVYLEGAVNLFSAVGNTTMAFAVDEPGAECGPSVSMRCRYLRVDRSCEVEVRRAGGIGDQVELVLRRPCRLLNDNADGTRTEVLLTAAVVRGRLTRVGAFTGGTGDAAIACDSTM